MSKLITKLTTKLALSKQSCYTLNNGLKIPIAGYGVYLIPKEKTKDMVYQALVTGYRHIDSAIIYHNQKQAAEGIAKFLQDFPDKAKREDIFFTTKINENAQGYQGTKKAVEDIAKDIKSSIDYVDLVLVHWPFSTKETRLGTYKALQEYVLNPQNPTLEIKSIGVSNYGVKHLEELFNWEEYKVKPVVDQLELHPWLPRVDLQEYLSKHNILLEAHTPLARGKKFVDPELVALSKKYNISPGQILLKWGYLQGFIVLAKTGTPTRIKENLDALPDAGTEDLELNEEIVKTLHKPDSKEVLSWGGNDPTLKG
ncbi:uncharacterized protein J8A68_003306 [[Candida] subhashii]|uniref:2-dehydropantolactone reductase n=1 Tax=[Candida] subhashii TaxID=561895 RepID=A0A8J5QML0_9ASCO|nr:uncharacterized protein J8A68_003306 [[Candida] subhashii]KAG7663128.1 hypothetical protein J8A68_003306 [[Candida] subhashii]